MRKRLLIVAGVALIVAVVLVARYDVKCDTGGKGYDIKCEQYSQPTAAPASLACKIYPSQDADQGKSSPPWWNKLLAWPEGITAWALILTLGAIVWQSWETRKSASAAFAQIQMTKAKERARLEIKGSSIGMGVLKRSDDSWWIKGNLQFRNTGISSAHIIETGGGIAIADSDRWPLPRDEESSLEWPDSVIEPSNKFGLVSTIREHRGTRDEFAIAVSSRKSVVYIQAFVKYKSLDTVWHRDIGVCMGSWSH